ncbi:CLUMA_CG000304, isoform A [Clunio marinus]|uniref:CLUMA_CG000304, isoform A n=1 Tax=Clunio marinus TaxID=568069 RepID=A0A1J1HIP6_9DIPT|nr:CLUMA_CG000304, isoform A [Clunio marinus]
MVIIFHQHPMGHETKNKTALYSFHIAFFSLLHRAIHCLTISSLLTMNHMMMKLLREILAFVNSNDTLPSNDVEK